LNKKQLYLNFLFSLLIIIFKSYQIIFVNGFFGSLTWNIFKESIVLISIYWLGIGGIYLLKTKFLSKK